MKYYKLLNQDLTSRNNTKWEIGVPVTIQKEGVEMCTDQVLHCYNHPLLAVILNPIHVGISNPKLFEIEVDKIVNNDGLKFASKSQTLLKEINLPFLTTYQQVVFAIKVAKLVCNDEKWNEWADKWLSGSDRSKLSAYNASVAVGYNNVTNSVANAIVYSFPDADTSTAYYASTAYFAASDKNEFNQKIISIIESIVKVEK
jgi:hypothetical protein